MVETELLQKAREFWARARRRQARLTASIVLGWVALGENVSGRTFVAETYGAWVGIGGGHV